MKCRDNISMVTHSDNSRRPDFSASAALKRPGKGAL